MTCILHAGELPAVCHTCRVRRVLRSKHCKIQRRCVYKFDHFWYVYLCVCVFPCMNSPMLLSSIPGAFCSNVQYKLVLLIFSFHFLVIVPCICIMYICIGWSLYIGGYVISIWPFHLYLCNTCMAYGSNIICIFNYL